MTWRKIDTAPKDQTPVLLAHGSDVFEGCLDRWGRVMKGDNLRFAKASHWKPLPAPPRGNS